ncbi:N-acetylmuramic acid 6-phosphate etherase [Dongshaea marina]|uniref:N-acetylmuramic acid 6-phosphate etherase n=1 Tax=Dongshaea marina TaxID=2047966 RepID=UPI000D3E4F6A|nr:N-acetylmuramic acid 6-phosphate etherase [Dongshaea marina]
MDLSQLISETRNPQTLNIDQMTTLEMVNCFNREDHKVPQAIEKVLPQIAEAIERITDAFRQGGRLIYCGAGTSGRLGILDASECPPTYGTPHEMVIGLIAGGKEAMFRAVEGAEDRPELGAEDLAEIKTNAKDVVVGIAASGRTPYVMGALKYANQVGATSIALSCNPGGAINTQAQLAITPVVGPEALTGSTRMKAGTAQKLILNMLTTGAMIKLGKAYSNLMVDVQATNEKLVERQKRIVMEATDCSPSQARDALEQSQYHCKTAIVMLLMHLDADQARQALSKNRGYIRATLNQG